MYKKGLLVLCVFQCLSSSQTFGQLEIAPTNILLERMPGQTVEILLNLTNPVSEEIDVLACSLTILQVYLISWIATLQEHLRRTGPWIAERTQMVKL